MHPYALLGSAIVAEIVATSSLKLSDGMPRLGPSAVVVIGYALSFWLLSMTLKALPIGFVYAVWSGIGVAAIALIGVFVFGEKLNWAGAGGIALIVAGVTLLQLSGQGVAE